MLIDQPNEANCTAPWETAPQRPARNRAGRARLFTLACPLALQESHSPCRAWPRLCCPLGRAARHSLRVK